MSVLKLKLAREPGSPGEGCHLYFNTLHGPMSLVVVITEEECDNHHRAARKNTTS